VVRKVIITLTLALLASAASVFAQTGGRRLDIQHADQWEVILSKVQDTTFYIGSVVFQTENGQIYCDSAIWLKGKKLKLKGRVILDDEDYHLAADSIDYDLVTNEAIAAGDYVELWSHRDSLFAVGTYAYYDRTNKTFAMRYRPTVFLKYPDSARMVKVIADSVHYVAASHLAEAIGKADITSKDLHATAGTARLNTENSRLELEDAPVASRRQSRINGREIVVLTTGDYLSRIEVHDSARGEFIEPTGADSVEVDRSILTGKEIIFDFDSGQLRTVTSSGQAYSWYLPSDRGKDESTENTVSGDTIVFQVEQEKLHTVVVQGGAIGSFLSTTQVKKDTTVVTKRDTIDYKAQTINYSLRDSLITLLRQSEVTSGDMILNAHRVTFNTKRRVVEAFSAEPPIDSVKSTSTFAANLQPNAIPVVLKDKGDVMYGDYLIYAIDTRKGRILKSKSKYETGFFYGNDLYRQQKSVYYLDDGRYTTCDAAEPHFHFHSKHLKLIENDRLIAKPVVFYIGRLPILAVPYYVFPLKKGRHSGILPFTLGNIERGERYIRNVGYYWAASDYWDLQTALDYYEQSNTINFYGKTTYARRYVYSGSLSGNYTRRTVVPSSSTKGFEGRQIRWTLSGTHNHTFSPSFQMAATGNYQSDNSFYQSYSTDLNERLNRVVRSQVSFTKRMSKSFSISGNITHDNNLDQNTRADQIPSLTFSQVRVFPLGSGRVDADGTLHRHFYNNLVATYSPSLLGYSARYPVVDSTIDTVVYKSNRHKEYAKATHSVGINMPLTVAKYFVLTPYASYNEAWYRVFRTELSDSAGIDPNTVYRAFAYSTGASLTTHLYGTMAPHLLGVNAFRQVIQPTVTYAFTPVANKNPEVRAYAGGGPGNASRAQTMNVTIQHVYQAKVQRNAEERTLDLLSVSHQFSYNFEATGNKYSDLYTSFSSTLLPKVNFSGSMTHSLYRPGTSELRWKSPTLMAFQVSANVSLAGKNFLFDDPNANVPRGSDSASQLAPGGSAPPAGGNAGWLLRAAYTYSESGRGSAFSKSSFLRATLEFSLTPSTHVSFNQSYDVGRGRTVYSSVSLSRQLHCWSGEFYWVPTGSTRGYGFRLYVTAIPAIKIDNTQSVVASSYLQSVTR
jgi:lipopolysaccharide assembly outer membrane protein LptD (OstA)